MSVCLNLPLFVSFISSLSCSYTSWLATSAWCTIRTYCLSFALTKKTEPSFSYNNVRIQCTCHEAIQAHGCSTSSSRDNCNKQASIYSTFLRRFEVVFTKYIPYILSHAAAFNSFYREYRWKILFFHFMTRSG